MTPPQKLLHQLEESRRHCAFFSPPGRTTVFLLKSNRQTQMPNVRRDARLTSYELAYMLAETHTAHGTLASIRAERARTREDQLAEWRAASDWYRKSLDTWSRVPHPARISMSGFEVTVPADVRSRLAQCELKIR